MKLKLKYSWLILIVLILADQLTKWGVRHFYAPAQFKNPGIGLGFFGSTPPLFLTLAAGLVFVIFLIVWWWYPSRTNLPIILIGSGAASNLIDRIFFGYVTDYIHLGFWSAFNLADVLIIAGAILYGYQILRHK